MAGSKRQRAAILGCARVASEEQLVEILRDPHWRNNREWASYVPKEIQESWDELPFAARVAAYLVAEERAQFGRDRGDIL